MNSAPPASPAPSVSRSGQTLERAAADLATRVAALEKELDALPTRSARDAAQLRRSDEVTARTRALRRDFLTANAGEIYDVLTDGRRTHVRLKELLNAAAVRFPGVVPAEARMAAERELVQADRDGLEIDQAVFCAAVLRHPRAGRHLVDAMLRPAPRSEPLLDVFRRTGRIELATVVVERRGRAAHVTFRNPDTLNAEDNQLIDDLEAAVDVVLLDDRCAAGVLRGGPVNHPRYQGRRVFSAGINLKELRNGRISFLDFLLGRELGYIHKIWRGVLTDPQNPSWGERCVQKPWAGVVDSFAIGGGMQLLLVLDRVIAEDEAYFSLPAADEGIVPGLANLRLTRTLGARLARSVILGGVRIAATDPRARLICDEIVPAEELDDAAERAAEQLAAPAVAANRRMLTLAEEPVELFLQYLADFAVIQAQRAYSTDVLAKVESRWQASRAVAGGIRR